jgi:molecular chaperone GrpE
MINKQIFLSEENMFKKDKQEQNNQEELLNENPFTEEAPASEEEASAQTETNADYEKLLEEKKTIESQFIRLAADFDNYRKRQEQERESLLKYGAEDTLKKLLPLLDTFERAQKSFKELDDAEKLKESFDAIQKQFGDALEKIGVEKIETTGKEFDPNFHEAVMQTPTSEHPDHTIIVELQSGYKLSDRILRPALVNVAVSE